MGQRAPGRTRENRRWRGGRRKCCKGGQGKDEYTIAAHCGCPRRRRLGPGRTYGPFKSAGEVVAHMKLRADDNRRPKGQASRRRPAIPMSAARTEMAITIFAIDRRRCNDYH